MNKMAGRKRIAKPRLQLPQQEQQRHAVRSAGDLYIGVIPLFS